MNKFLRRKAAPEPLNSNDDALHALSSAPPSQASPPLKKTGANRWKKSKKPVEQRTEIDLDLALPSNDDLRTSLFMPALTARFSMLREQDDPNTLVGKASDDSVLQPRRRSRMDLGLDDIAEVSSLRSSIRPPFADRRQDSFASEDGYYSENESSHNGNIMTRARPGEGNNMFGGRQKVYMIPKSGAASARNLGRVVYEDDIATSPFQQYRLHRQYHEQTRVSNDSHGFDFGLDQTDSGDQDDRDAPLPSDSAKDLSHSPSLSSDNKRSTNSTSHSEARSSTAATSIASQPVTTAASPVKPSPQPHQQPLSASPLMQPLKRADTKTRRLYEQGLDQHMHEQQSSAMNRLNSIHRQRALSTKQPPHLHSAKSVGSLHDKARQQVYALPALDSSSTISLFTGFGPAGLSNSNCPSPVPSAPATPLTSTSGFDYDEYNALSQALEPADRGKATAMGAFNKPKQSFDEQQYLERQRQLQRSVSNAAGRKDLATQAVRQPSTEHVPKVQPISAFVLADVPDSRVPGKPHEPSRAYNVFRKATQQNNAQAESLPADKATLPDPHRTFFGDISASDSEDGEEDRQIEYSRGPKMPDYGYGTQHGKWQPTILPAVSEHPALRANKSKASLTETEEGTSGQPLQPTSSNPTRMPPPRIQTEHDEVESPVLGAAGPTVALNGLMHHLRSKSNVSSITQKSDTTSTFEPLGPAELTSKNLDLVNRPTQSNLYSGSRAGSFAHSNPWDLEDTDMGNPERRPVSRASVSPIDSDHLTAPFGSHANSTINRQSAVSALELDMEDEDQDQGQGQGDLQTQHTRDTSTATQQDRDAFERELAARRNNIRENIRKSKVERENQSRGVSPARRPFGILRPKSSRESMDSPRAPDLPSNFPLKAQRILGSAGGGHNVSPGIGTTPSDGGAQNGDLSRPRDWSNPLPPVPNIPARISQRHEQEPVRQLQQFRPRENSDPEAYPAANGSSPSSAGSRSRASSAAGLKSRSRAGTLYKDDLEKAMAEGTGASTSMVNLDMSAFGPRDLTPRSTPDMNQNAFEGARARSGSRPMVNGYFDSKGLHLTHTNSASRERLTPGAPSPALSANPYSPMASPALRSPASSFAQNMTPPLSAASTPLQSTFSQSVSMPPSSVRPGGVLRKRTISKGTISEPTLISSTSNVELVDLPEGASLKNGIDEPPPVPPINPARRATKRILSLGRNHSHEGSSNYSGRFSRSKTPESGMRKSSDPELEMPVDVSQSYRSRSGTISPQKLDSNQSFDHRPALVQSGFSSTAASPENPVSAPVTLDGAMF